MKMGTFKSVLLKVVIRSTMFLAYLLLGAVTFLFLEQGDHKSQMDTVIGDLNHIKENLKREKNVTGTELQEFQEKIEFAINIGAIGSRKLLRNWDFANSFFFCGNVITTIGYGHITPQTDSGQIVVMLYALFGIPLTGFFLRTVGNELTTFIAFVIKYCERRQLNREAEKLEIKCAVVSMLLALVMLFFGSTIFSQTESRWSYLNSFYFCFVSLTTIGFGDYIPGVGKEMLTQTEKLLIEMACLIYYVIGLSIMSGVIVSISSAIEEKTKKLDLADPMDAIRTLRLENLNSKAMKKLGYKVDEGVASHHMNNHALPNKLGQKKTNNHVLNHSSVNQNRRGTIVPAESPPVFRKIQDDIETEIKSWNGSVSKEPSERNRSQEYKVDITPTPSRCTTPTMTSRLEEASNHSSTSTNSESNDIDSKLDNTSKQPKREDKEIKAISGGGCFLHGRSSQDSKKKLLIQSSDKENENEIEKKNSGYSVCSESVLRDKINSHAEETDGMNTMNKNTTRKFILTDQINSDRSINIQNVRANSLINLKALATPIHRKMDQKKPQKNTKKPLKKHSSLKDIKIQYSNNIQTYQKWQILVDKEKNNRNSSLPSTSSTTNDTKRVGLPAELFANDVSFQVNGAQCKGGDDKINANFHSILPSPDLGYSNQCFQMDKDFSTTSDEKTFT